MIVLGCDPSLTDFGWIVIDTEKEGSDHIVGEGRIRTDSDTLEIERYLKHRREIGEIVEEYDIDYAGIEKPPPNSSWSAGLYPIWMYAFEHFYHQRIPFVILMPPGLKAFAREVLDDSGKMSKQDMKDAATKLMGGEYPGKGKLNHNVADAYLEAHYAGRFKKLIEGEIEEDDLTEKEKYKFTRTVTKRKTGRVQKKGILYKEGEKHYALDDPKYDSHYESQKTIFDD
jgi:hypothetical protein